MKESKDADTGLYRWFRMVIGLSQMRPDRIRQVWHILENHFYRDIRNGLPHNVFRLMVDFMDYFRSQWLDNNTKGRTKFLDSTEMIHLGEVVDYMWSKWDVESIRSTNNAEGYHSGIKHSLPRNHPSLKHFITWLQGENFKLKMHLDKLRRPVNPEMPKKRKKEYVKVDEDLALYKEEMHQVIFTCKQVTA